MFSKTDEKKITPMDFEDAITLLTILESVAEHLFDLTKKRVSFSGNVESKMYLKSSLVSVKCTISAELQSICSVCVCAVFEKLECSFPVLARINCLNNSTESKYKEELSDSFLSSTAFPRERFSKLEELDTRKKAESP